MKTIPFQPVGNRILVEPCEADNKTASGLFIPETSVEKPNKGKIVAKGQGMTEKDPVIELGAIVAYNKHAGMTVELEDENNEKHKFLLMNINDVHGIYLN